MCYSLSVEMTWEQWVEVMEIYRKFRGSAFQEMIKSGVPAMYFLDAFKDNHPPVPVITQENPNEVQFFRWGVIPPYAKYMETTDKNGQPVKVHPWYRPNYYHSTANAKVEELPAKPTWKRLYKKKRCLVIVSGFFEFYHMPGKKVTYPHYISLKDRPVFAFEGLYDQWTDSETGEVVDTFSILTTKPNDMMKVIHNNPKAHSGPRMPVILLPEEWNNWIEGEMSNEDVMQFAEPFPVYAMQAVPVRQGLKKRDVDSNIPAVLERIKYPELPDHWSRYGEPRETQSSLF